MTKDLTEIHDLLKSIKSFNVDDTIDLLEEVMQQEQKKPTVKLIVEIPHELYNMIVDDSRDQNTTVNEEIVDALHVFIRFRGSLK